MSFLSKLNRDNPQKPHLYKWSATSVKQWCCKAKGVSYYGATAMEAYDGWVHFVYGGHELQWFTPTKKEDIARSLQTKGDYGDGPGKITWAYPASK